MVYCHLYTDEEKKSGFGEM